MKSGVRPAVLVPFRLSATHFQCRTLLLLIRDPQRPASSNSVLKTVQACVLKGYVVYLLLFEKELVILFDFSTP